MTASINTRPRTSERHKQTEVGLIPEDWAVSPLRSCLRRTPRYGINAASVTFDDNLPIYLRITDISEVGRFVPSPRVSVRHPNAPDYFLSQGDLVFARTGASVGKSYLYCPDDGPLVFAGFLIQITPNPSTLDPVYLAHYVQSKRYWDWVATVSIRSGQPGINGQEYGTFPVPIPDIKEQRAIAEALSDVDGLIGALEKLIAKKRAIKQAAMQQLLTGKTRLPGFDSEWRMEALGKGVSLFSGHHVLAQHCNVTGEGVPYLTGPADFPERVIIQTKFTTKPGTICESGDILVTVKGSGSGMLVVADAPYCISRQLMALRVEAWDSHFVFYSLLQNASRIHAATTGLIPGLSRRDILDQELPLPRDMNEQTAIATVLSDMDAEIAALERRRDKTKQIKQGMMQQLLTGRIRLVKPATSVEQADEESKGRGSHSKAFNEAVVISTLSRHFGTEEYPLGRKRYTKLSYLLHRRTDGQITDYLKKAAGPYNPKTKYGGPERIAVESGYIREYKNGAYRGFIAADNIAKAEGYFEKWYGPDAIQWLEQFRYKNKDELELLTTVDVAAEELRASGKNLDVAGVKDVIRNHPEWKTKLDRPIFSDGNIAKAIETSGELFGDIDKCKFPR